MPVSRPSYYQGEDIILTIQIDRKYITDYERLFAYAYFDDDHHFLTSTEPEYIQMTVDAANATVTIHISNAVTGAPQLMPVGIWTLELMTVYNETEYRSIYQNLKQFELKKSYIVFSRDIYITRNVRIAMQRLNHYRGETITFRLKGDDVFSFQKGSGPEGVDPYFIVFIYPDGINFDDTSQQSKIKHIYSTDESQSSVTGHDGYVEWISQDIEEPGVSTTVYENEVQCVLPYTVTKTMDLGKYTVEVLYAKYDTDSNLRSVLKINNAFTLIAAASQLIDTLQSESNTQATEE